MSTDTGAGEAEMRSDVRRRMTEMVANRESGGVVWRNATAPGGKEARNGGGPKCETRMRKHLHVASFVAALLSRIRLGSIPRLFRWKKQKT